MKRPWIDYFEPENRPWWINVILGAVAVGGSLYIFAGRRYLP